MKLNSDATEPVYFAYTILNPAQLPFTKTKIQLIGFIVILIFTTCKKYEEGPSFSLRTKKARLTGEWIMMFNGKEEYFSQRSTKISCGSDTFLLNFFSRKREAWVFERDHSLRVSGNDAFRHYEWDTAANGGYSCPPKELLRDYTYNLDRTWEFDEQKEILAVKGWMPLKILRLTNTELKLTYETGFDTLVFSKKK